MLHGPDSLGLRVRARRIALNLTQEELARRADVAHGTVYTVEAKSAARIDTVRKLAAALGCEMGELLPTVHKRGIGKRRAARGDA